MLKQITEYIAGSVLWKVGLVVMVFGVAGALIVGRDALMALSFSRESAGSVATLVVIVGCVYGLYLFATKGIDWWLSACLYVVDYVLRRRLEPLTLRVALLYYELIVVRAPDLDFDDLGVYVGDGCLAVAFVHKFFCAVRARVLHDFERLLTVRVGRALGHEYFGSALLATLTGLVSDCFCVHLGKYLRHVLQAYQVNRTGNRTLRQILFDPNEETVK